jgi:tRNA-Thr(GGU) m(6)t(6)A37 methyltransferase TsaA
MILKVIAYARNGHTDKFGIPRQSREESPILTRIVFEPDYNVPEALRGIEGYSHLWLIWGFSEVDSWSPTVRPPRLGGNKRMGVFATRSPFRPNPIGLSSVRLVRVGQGELVVSGADVLDGTPIYDIKPYLSFSDSHPDAKNGFAEEHKNDRLEVDWGLISRKCLDNGSILPREWLDDVEEKWVRDVEYILSQDPRPAYQDDPEREYKMDYDGYTVTFSVNKQVVVVKKIEKQK